LLLIVWMMGLAIHAPAQELTPETASRFAQQVLHSVSREFPNKLDHVMNSEEEVRSPRSLHPSFFGCFDWHSSVHGHWVLVRLLRTHPDLKEGQAIRSVLEEHLAPASIKVETAYFLDPAHKGFERTYGWAWLLKLAAELKDWDTADARRWSAQLEPLAQAVARSLEDYLPRLTYPNRTGVHPNTAFTLDLAMDFARASRNADLERLLAERARAYYAKDRRGPLAWEPGGEDFLSPCLEEAALMARILGPKDFRAWVGTFLPGFLKDPALKPALVSDRTDPRIVHLDGLNLSRARCLHVIAKALGPKDARGKALERLAREHAEAALPHVVSGNYGGDHWLATFAVRMLEASSSRLVRGPIECKPPRGRTQSP
jgi:hypothetical protein